jgi:hypothetical protein
MTVALQNFNPQLIYYTPSAKKSHRTIAPWFGFHTNFEIRPGRCQQPRAQSRAPARDAPPALPTDLRPHRSDARSARRRRRETRGEHDGSRCVAVSNNEKTRDPHPNRTFGCRGLRTARARSASRVPPTAGAQTLTPPSPSPRSPGVAPGAREPDQRRGAPGPAADRISPRNGIRTT